MLVVSLFYIRFSRVQPTLTMQRQRAWQWGVKNSSKVKFEGPAKHSQCFCMCFIVKPNWRIKNGGVRPTNKISRSDKPSALSIPLHPATLNCPTHTSTHASSRQPMKYPYHPTACTHIKWSVLYDALSVKNWHFLYTLTLLSVTYTYVYVLIPMCITQNTI